LLANQPYIGGEEIKVAGASFKVLGNPYPGEEAIAASLPFSALPPVPAAVINPGETLTITVGGKLEEFTFAAGVAAGDTAGFVAALNNGAAVPPALPTGNAAKLVKLSISVSAAGFVSPTGLNIAVKDGSASANAIMGSSSATRSVNLPFTLPITAHDFSTAPVTFQLAVNGKTETLTFNQNITNQADLAAAFNGPANATQLARLGLSVTELGIISNASAKVTIQGGNTFLDAVVGLATQGAGTSSVRGVLVQPGDSFFIDSTDKQALLTTLSRFSEAMKTVKNTPEDKAKLGEIVAKTLTNLTNAETTLTSVQGEVGSRLNTLESSMELNLDIVLFSEATRSSLQDVNYADATIQLSMQSLVFSAAQQSFAKVSQLSLFNYL
jgi:flagellar hook-associated protein 3 FlgL